MDWCAKFNGFLSCCCILILINLNIVHCVDKLSVPNYVGSISKRSPHGSSDGSQIKLMMEESCRVELHRVCHYLKDDSEDIDVFQCIQINNVSVSINLHSINKGSVIIKYFN